MRHLLLAAAALLLTTTLGCSKRKTSDVGSVRDSAMPPAAAPAPAVADNTTTPANFSFDQRAEFSASVRQQLAGIDQQIKDLVSQAKSRGGAVSDHALARIRAARQRVSGTLKRIDGATAANWEGRKRDVNKSVESLNESIDGALPK